MTTPMTSRLDDHLTTIGVWHTLWPLPRPQRKDPMTMLWPVHKYFQYYFCVSLQNIYSKYYRIICAQSFYYVDQYIKLHANINSVLFSTTIRSIIYYHLLHFVDLLCQLLATKYAINCADMTQSLYPLTLRSQFKVKQHAAGSQSILSKTRRNYLLAHISRWCLHW